MGLQLTDVSSGLLGAAAGTTLKYRGAAARFANDAAGRANLGLDRSLPPNQRARALLEKNILAARSATAEVRATSTPIRRGIDQLPEKLRSKLIDPRLALPRQFGEFGKPILSKVPVVGLVATGVGVAVDIADGKDPTRAIASGGGRFRDRNAGGRGDRGPGRRGRGSSRRHGRRIRYRPLGRRYPAPAGAGTGEGIWHVRCSPRPDSVTGQPHPPPGPVDGAIARRGRRRKEDRAAPASLPRPPGRGPVLGGSRVSNKIALIAGSGVPLQLIVYVTLYCWSSGDPFRWVDNWVIWLMIAIVPAYVLLF